MRGASRVRVFNRFKSSRSRVVLLALAILMIAFAALLVVVFVLRFYIGSATAQTAQIYITPQSFAEPYSYIVFKDADGLAKVKDGMTGQVVYASSDDASAIQYAVNALTSGGRILIKRGIYLIRSTIIISNPAVYIEGETLGWNDNGTILRLDADVDMIVYDGVDSHKFFGGIRSIYLDGNGRKGKGIWIKGYFSDIHFEDMVVNHFGDTGILFMPDSGKAVWNVWIVNSLIEGCSNYGGIAFKSPSAAVDRVRIISVHLSGNTYGIYNDKSNTYRVEVIGGSIEQNVYHGIFIYAGDFRIIGVAINDNGAGKPNNFDGIHLGNPTSNTIIIGCDIWNKVTSNQRYAIYEEPGSDYNIIAYNRVQGATGAIYRSGVHTKVVGNIGYTTENSGTATIPAGQTRVTVSHGLALAPSKVLVTPYGNARVWVENITNTSFDIVTDTAPTADLTVAWYAEV